LLKNVRKTSVFGIALGGRLLRKLPPFRFNVDMFRVFEWTLLLSSSLLEPLSTLAVLAFAFNVSPHGGFLSRSLTLLLLTVISLTGSVYARPQERGVYTLSTQGTEFKVSRVDRTWTGAAVPR
jgi:hypothetical protein